MTITFHAMKVGHDAVTVRTVILIAVVAAPNDLTVAYEAVQGILVKIGVVLRGMVNIYDNLIRL